MHIAPLTASTVRRLGSSQVLTSPVSVVKELLENSLDAEASRIEVLVQHNTFDSIEVRDNGHGIPPADQAMVARRHCTSKLVNCTDLRTIGGKSYGFRGEALASLAELCETMIVTTRVDGEVRATVLNIGKDGEVNRSRASANPVGTTVKVTGFLSTFPVRKQTTLKGSTKYLAEIRRLLESYAMACPTVRYTLRVLKSPSPNQNWAYAPKARASMKDICVIVLGRECASMCESISVKDGQFDIKALLPRADANSSKISGIGQYISVDSRPMSSSGATHKLVANLFKSKFKSSRNDCEAVKDPFMWMNIACPAGIYDANLEPGKDDLLFENQKAFMEIIDAALNQFYVNEEPPRGGPSVEPNLRSNGEMTMLDSTLDRPDTMKCISLSTMHDRDDDLDSLFHHMLETAGDEKAEEDGLEVLNSVALSNPWTIAKMHTKVSAYNTGVSSTMNSTSQAKSHKTRPEKVSRTPNARQTSRTQAVGGLLTPQCSSPSPRGPIQVISKTTDPVDAFLPDLCSPIEPMSTVPQYAGVRCNAVNQSHHSEGTEHTANRKEVQTKLPNFMCHKSGRKSDGQFSSLPSGDITASPRAQSALSRNRTRRIHVARADDQIENCLGSNAHGDVSKGTATPQTRQNSKDLSVRDLIESRLFGTQSNYPRFTPVNMSSIHRHSIQQLQKLQTTCRMTVDELIEAGGKFDWAADEISYDAPLAPPSRDSLRLWHLRVNQALRKLNRSEEVILSVHNGMVARFAATE